MYPVSLGGVFNEPTALLEKSRVIDLPGAGGLSYIRCTNNSDSSRQRATLWKCCCVCPDDDDDDDDDDDCYCYYYCYCYYL